jgi:hypothetical protein
MVAAPTTCRAILVSGRMAATVSTIWKRAWRLDMMPFWPVTITMGMAPSWA